MEKIKVIIIDGQGEDRDLVSSTLSKLDYVNLVNEVDTIEEANSLIDDVYPNIVIIGSNVNFDKYLLSNNISREYEDIGIILIEDILKEDTVYNGIAAGAKDVLISPFTSSKLVDSVYRVNELMKDVKTSPKEKRDTAKKSSGRGHTITVFSTKGGVGKTFLSTNLAIALKETTNKKVCLVDLDLDFGNVILALNTVPRVTISDIVDDIRSIDQDSIESYLTPHESGITLLPANIKPEINDFINADHIETILKALRGAFDYIIVDMPARFYDPVNPAFQFADLLLMVTTPEVSTIRNIKSSIQTLHELNFPKDKIKVVLNKLDNKTGIKVKDVESTLNQNVYAGVDANYKVVISSLNTGSPIILSRPRSAIGRSISSLAKKIDGEFLEVSGR